MTHIWIKRCFALVVHTEMLKLQLYAAVSRFYSTLSLLAMFVNCVYLEAISVASLWQMDALT